jgi:hypothetical protein
MPNGDFPGNLPPFKQLNASQKQFLFEHYRRCEAFWRHWTHTIWSIPSVSAAINIGAYAFLFGSQKPITTNLQILALFILVLLNGILTVGLYRHRHMQQQFGKRILAIEKYAGIPIIKLSETVKGSLIYLIAMIIISLISFGLFFCKIFGCV